MNDINKNKQPILVTENFICPESTELFEILKKSTRAAVTELLGTCPFPNTPPLNPQILSTTEYDSYYIKKVRYGNDSDDIVWAYLAVPKGHKEPLPAIICLPGSYMTPNWGKDAIVGLAGPAIAGTPEAYGRDLAELGFITLCPDYPCAGERVKKGYKPYDTYLIDKKFPDWTRMGLSIWDVSRAVDFLETVPEVNNKKIGCMGWSQGGDTALWAGAMDLRISVIVSVCGWSPFEGRYTESLAAPYNYPRLKDFVRTRCKLPFDMGHIAAMIAPRPFLNINASKDEFFANKAQLQKTEHSLEKLYDLLGNKDRFRSFEFKGIHAYTIEAANETQVWFKRWLK